jgi:hypothetical protein
LPVGLQARDSPPSPQISGFVQTRAGVKATDSLQHSGRNVAGGEASLSEQIADIAIAWIKA